MPSLRTLLAGRLARRFATVAGFTALSRLSGFVRDLALAALLGSGAMADAFFLALRLPNHFRALFAEGAFNSSFVPTYAAALAQRDQAAALGFAARVMGLVVLVQALILGAAELGMEGLTTLLAPGLAPGDGRFELTVTLTRITFPYLALVTLVTVYGAILNAHQRFAAAASAPILFNAAIIGALGLATLFPSPAHAAAWGVALAGLAEVILVHVAARRAGVSPGIALPRLDADLRTFLKRFGPATLGSGSAQIAMFADTIVAALLPVGAVSALYYADRLYQLPVGVIAVALGTVLLPALATLVAQDRQAEAVAALRRSALFGVLVALPFVALFLILPELLVKLVFARGAFGPETIDRAGEVLRGYGFGLAAVILLRPFVSAFHARGDTTTPMWVALAAMLVNVALKFALMTPFDVAGLAYATTAGLWINLGALMLIARRRGYW